MIEAFFVRLKKKLNYKMLRNKFALVENKVTLKCKLNLIDVIQKYSSL